MIDVIFFFLSLLPTLVHVLCALAFCIVSFNKVYYLSKKKKKKKPGKDKRKKHHFDIDMKFVLLD